MSDFKLARYDYTDDENGRLKALVDTVSHGGSVLIAGAPWSGRSELASEALTRSGVEDVLVVDLHDTVPMRNRKWDGVTATKLLAREGTLDEVRIDSSGNEDTKTISTKDMRGVVQNLMLKQGRDAVMLVDVQNADDIHVLATAHSLGLQVVATTWLGTATCRLPSGYQEALNRITTIGRSTTGGVLNPYSLFDGVGLTDGSTVNRVFITEDPYESLRTVDEDGTPTPVLYGYKFVHDLEK